MRAFAEGVGTRLRVVGSILYVSDHLGRLIDKIQGGLTMMSWPVRLLLVENSRHFRADHLKIRPQKDPGCTL
jgi:hypothetical protein